MIFSYTFDLLFRDEKPKIRTRRIWKPNWEIRFSPVSRVLTHDGQFGCQIWDTKNKRVVYEEGKTYAAQKGYGQKAEGRFLCTSLFQAKVQDITNEQAIEEGFEGWTEYGYIPGECVMQPERDIFPREHFQRIWNQIHRRRGTRFEDNPDVLVIGCEGIKN